MVAVRQGAKVGIDHRQHFFHLDPHDGALRRELGRHAAGRGLPRLLGVPIGHDHEHGLDFSGGQEIVHNVVQLAPLHPAVGVLAAAMPQIQHRIASARILLIARRRVHIDLAPGLRQLGAIPAFVDIPVGHVFWQIEINSWLGYFDSGDLPVSGIGPAGRIIHRRAIDHQPVGMQAGHCGWGRHRPRAVLIAHHVEGALAEPIGFAGR